MARHKVETSDICLFNPYFTTVYIFIGLVFGLIYWITTVNMIYLI